MQFCYPGCCRSVRGEPPAPAAVRTRVTVSLPVTAVLLSAGVTATAVWQAEHAHTHRVPLLSCNWENAGRSGCDKRTAENLING